MPRFRSLTLAVCIVAVLHARSSIVRGQSVYPIVMSISPVAIDTGSTTTCLVRLQKNFNSPHTFDEIEVKRTSRVIISGEGVTAHIVPEPTRQDVDNAKTPAEAERLRALRLPPYEVQLAFTVAEDATPGVRDVRIVTPRGASSLCQVVVVQDRLTRESEDNDTVAGAQAVSLPTTVCGELRKPEDVDVYKFAAKEGDPLVCYVFAARVQQVLHELHKPADPILTLRTKSGATLATSDNFYSADPLLAFRIPVSGEYYLEIRDLRYLGNKDWPYAIQIAARPLALTAMPLHVAPGKANKLELVGFHTPAGATAALDLPTTAPDGIHWFAPRLGSDRLNSVPVVVSHLPQIVETTADNSVVTSAQSMSVPAMVSGRIESAGDVDYYAFEAKKGEQFAFEVTARAVQSKLDSNLRIFDAQGHVLGENDDRNHIGWTFYDSFIESWQAPGDGRYFLEIRDTNDAGGPLDTYCIRAEHAQPWFTLDTDSARTPVAPGATSVIFVETVRKNGFEGEIQLDIDGLPAGVTAHCGRILAGRKHGCILLSGAAGAPTDVRNVRITGHAFHPLPDGGKLRLTATAVSGEEIHLFGGSRHHVRLAEHILSVNEPADLRSVKLSTDQVVLKPGESKRVEVTIERRPDFTQGINLDLIHRHLKDTFEDCLPEGVTIDDRASKLYLSGSDTKGTIVLTAAEDAKPVHSQQVPVMAHIALTFVAKYTVCGPPLYITVTER